MTRPGSNTIWQLMQPVEPVYRFFVESAYARRQGEPGINDFAVGNPQEMPLPAFAAALQRWAVPQHKDWFAYVESEAPARAVVAKYSSLPTRR